MNKEELKTRKIEFLEKFKDLMSDYNVAMGVNSDGTIYIVTDGHKDESWNEETLINDLTEECIEEVLNILD